MDSRWDSCLVAGPYTASRCLRWSATADRGGNRFSVGCAPSLSENREWQAVRFAGDLDRWVSIVPAWDHHSFAGHAEVQPGEFQSFEWVTWCKDSTPSFCLSSSFGRRRFHVAFHRFLFLFLRFGGRSMDNAIHGYPWIEDHPLTKDPPQVDQCQKRPSAAVCWAAQQFGGSQGHVAWVEMECGIGHIATGFRNSSSFAKQSWKTRTSEQLNLPTGSSYKCSSHGTVLWMSLLQRGLQGTWKIYLCLSASTDLTDLVDCPPSFWTLYWVPACLIFKQNECWKLMKLTSVSWQSNDLLLSYLSRCLALFGWSPVSFFSTCVVSVNMQMA